MAINLCFLTSDKTNLNDTWKQSNYQVASTKYVMQGAKGFIMLIPTLMADLYTDLTDKMAFNLGIILPMLVLVANSSSKPQQTGDI